MRVLIIAACEGGRAEPSVERLKAPVSCCRFTVAIADHHMVGELRERPRGCAEVVTYAFDRTSALPCAVHECPRLAARDDAVHSNSNHPASREGFLMHSALSSGRGPALGEHIRTRFAWPLAAQRILAAHCVLVPDRMPAR